MKRDRPSRGNQPRRWNRGSILLLALGLCFGSLPGARALAWTPEDSAFGSYLIRELKYLDTAERWLDSMEARGRGSSRDRSEVASLRIDILLAQGKEEEAATALEKFKKAYPGHPRASAGSLDLISRAMGTVVAAFEKAKVTTDPAKAETLRTQAKTYFQEKVERALDVLIVDLNAQVDRLQKAHREATAKKKGGPPVRSPELDNKIFARDRAELSRLKAYLVYGRQLDKDDADRKALLEKGATLADEYVERRYDFFVMQYEGQLQRGLFAYALGKYSVADDNLSILYDIMPPGQPPYPVAVVDAFKSLRMQAVLFGARAMIASDETRRGLAIVESHFIQSTGGPFDLSEAEDDPKLRQYAILLRLEYGVALVVAGRNVEGLDQIQKVIAKYSQGGAMQAAYLNDARKALARVVALGVKLRGKDYLQAAKGLKGQLDWEGALDMFQLALSTVEPSSAEDRKIQLACLNEIGECSFILGRYYESALAYKDVHDYLKDLDDDLIVKVAQNYLAAATKASEAGSAGHGVLETIVEEARKFYDAKAEGDIALEQLKMVDAGRLEDGGNLTEARKKYLSVSRQTKKGKTVPFYWRAQASAWMCVYKLWDRADADGKKDLEPELDKAIEELEKIISEALSEQLEDESTRDTAGAATAALGLGQIHFAYTEDWQRAVNALSVFTTDLAEEKNYRCMGLGYLILAGARLSTCDPALQQFLALRKCEECVEDQVVGLAAQALSDCFYEAGDLKKAAVLILMWARHASAMEDLEKPRVLLLVASRLIEGGMSKQAIPYIESIREKLAGDSELERQLLILDAKRHTVAKDWNKVVETLEKYVSGFEARGDKYEDPYVRKDLAEAYISRGNGKPPTRDVEKAEMHYSTALFIINQRLAQDPKLDRTFWVWAKRWLQIKMFLGEAGQTSAYGDVIAFAERFKHKEMGGKKDEFIKLGEDAAAKQQEALRRSR